MKKTEPAKTVAAGSRIWCDACHIRIAPTEERIVRSAHHYHLRCRPKPRRPTDQHLLHC